VERCASPTPTNFAEPVYAVLSHTLFQRGVFVLFLQQRGFSAGQVALLQTLLYLVSGVADGSHR
jgi:hypothetical protein